MSLPDLNFAAQKEFKYAENNLTGFDWVPISNAIQAYAYHQEILTNIGLCFELH